MSVQIFANGHTTYPQEGSMVVDGSGGEGWYRLLFERAGDAILVMERDRVVDANPRACVLLGLSREEVAGAPMSRLFPFGCATQIMELLTRALDEGSAYGEIELLSGSGEETVVSILASKASEDVCILMLRDMGKRNEMERRLLQAEKMAALGRLSAAMAHEINNPLTGVANYLALLKRRISDRKASQYIRSAEKEVERITMLIRRLLDFYQPMHVLMQEVSVNGVVEDVLSLLSDSFKVRNIRVSKHLDGSVPPIVASVDQLRQVMINIFVNSIDAIGEGGGEIHVSTSQDEHYVVVRIRDNGAGIPDDVLPHIFEPFFSTKRKTSGTGLGLFVSYGIVRELGGRIEVESAHGVGTEFSLCFPKSRAQSRQLIQSRTSLP